MWVAASYVFSAQGKGAGAEVGSAREPHAAASALQPSRGLRHPPLCASRLLFSQCCSGWACLSWGATWCSWWVLLGPAGQGSSVALFGAAAPDLRINLRTLATCHPFATNPWICYSTAGNARPQMSLALYVGNAIKDLVCSPRPLSVSYGRERLKFLGASDEEVELNAKVGSMGWLEMVCRPRLSCGSCTSSAGCLSQAAHSRGRRIPMLRRSMACPPATPSTPCASTTWRCGTCTTASSSRRAQRRCCTAWSRSG